MTSRETSTAVSPALRWFGLPTIIPVVLGILYALGDYAGSNSGRIDPTDPAFVLRLFVCLALFVGGFEGAYHLFVRRPAQRRARKAAAIRVAREAGLSPDAIARVTDAVADPASDPKRPRILRFGWNKADIITGAVLIMLCWLPYLVWLFPGTLWYDTSWQVYEYYSGSLSDHHPFLLVYLYGAFIDMGRALLGDGTYGMFVLICLQYIAAAFGFSLVCSYLHRAGARRGLCVGILLFFGLFPFFPMMFCSIVKDTLQAVLFIYFSLLFCEVVRTRGELLRKTWPCIALLLLGLAICIVKKTGVYVVAPSLIALAFMKLRWGGRALLPLIGALLAVVMLVVFPRLVLPALDVEPGGKQESLAVPIQQVAHDVKYYGDEFSDEDKQLINDFLWIDFDDIPSEFDYEIVDPIKDGSLRDDTLIPQFMALWARLAAAHPLGTLEGWMGMEAGWFSFDPSLVVKVASGEVANSDFLDSFVSWPDAGTGNSIATDAFNLPKSIPLISVLYNQGLWATMLPVFCLYVVAKTKTGVRLGRWCTLLMLSPYLMTVVSLMVCPVSTDVEAARYLIAMVSVGLLYTVLATLMAKAALASELTCEEDDEARGAAGIIAAPAYGPMGCPDVAARDDAPAGENAEAQGTPTAQPQTADANGPRAE
ncbi:MAG: hypothetical protein KHZ24_03925 [Coriobacteriia bacterium]|nr:hypothetical protein [Coriobacteriia bacterium]